MDWIWIGLIQIRTAIELIITDIKYKFALVSLSHGIYYNLTCISICF